MYTLSDSRRQKLRDMLVVGANRYYNYLCDKNFLLVCEDGKLVTISFVKNEFKHLSGVLSELNKRDFFSLCLNSNISSGNIEILQKYNWSTLNFKAKKLSRIQDLLYQDGEKILLLNSLETHTTTFPIAVKNESVNICVGCISRNNKAHSLRKANNSMTAAETKKIKAIFAK